MEHESPISLRVVKQVAAQKGVAPTELTPPLHHAINTDALDSLYDSAKTDRLNPSITFDYNGYQVHIDTAGEVHLEETSPVLDSDTQSLSC